MNFKPRGDQPLSTITISSRFKYGDPVVVCFGTAGIIQNCKVIKVHSTESSISYDVEVKWKHIDSADNYSVGVDKERGLTDRLYNLDSAVVFSPDDFEQKWVSPEDELPSPRTLLLIKRKSGHIYLGLRIDAPLSTNPDPSQECRWYGNLFADMSIDGYALEFKNNFSDVTVEGWVYLSESINWINDSLKPEDVFDAIKLHQWAQGNGYARPMVKPEETL